MSLNIDIDVANLAVARLKCMLKNWAKLASADVSIDGGEHVILLDSNWHGFAVDVTKGLCNVFDDIGLEYDDYTEFYKSWVDVHRRDSGKPNLTYPVGGHREYDGTGNLYTNPKRKALAEWCLQCLEEYVAEYEH